MRRSRRVRTRSRSGSCGAYAKSLDHILPLSERHVRAVLAEFVTYYNQDRPHRSLTLERSCAELSPARRQGSLAARPPRLAPCLRASGLTPHRLLPPYNLGPYYYAPAAQVMINQQWAGTGNFLVPAAVGFVAALTGLVVFRLRDITP